MTYGLIGAKLGHSYSKIIHEMLGRYTYNMYSFTPEEFASFMEKDDFSALNITIPYKKAVIPYCRQVSDLAMEIGAVNTVYHRDGKLHGTNTDYIGFLYAASSAGISFEGRKVLILGNGGTSLTVRTAVRNQGASEILITTRRGEEGCISYEDLKDHRDVEIIINTTPVGTYPDNGGRLINLAEFPACTGVIDVIYNPFATDLLQQAAELGIPHSNGLPMLVAQATAAAEYFTGEEGFSKENPRIIASLKKEIENIVLIGMPGCGKSTIGRKLASRTGKTFVDLDKVIEQEASMTIPEIFSKYGEDHFRMLETEAAKKVGKEKGQVIATGGGVILKPENMKALSQNGRVVFMDRPLRFLATKGRPLSKDKKALETMYEIRFPLYNKYGQVKIGLTKSIGNNVNKLMSLLGYSE